MKITSTLTSTSTGNVYNVEYEDGDPRLLQDESRKVVPIQGVHAFCFHKGKLVLVRHPRSGWTPPGGRVEVGETIEAAVTREVHEETNMRVLFQTIIGYQDIYEPNNVVRQIRSFCIVEPYGPFIKDPDGDISEITEIDPDMYMAYFSWGSVGDHIMKQAIALYKTHVGTNIHTDPNI